MGCISSKEKGEAVHKEEPPKSKPTQQAVGKTVSVFCVGEMGCTV